MTRTTCTTYNALDKIEATQYPLLLVPFHGTYIWIKVRELTLNQINNCGDISLIETFQDRVRAKHIKRRDIVQHAEIQHKLVKESLISPTYGEIMEKIANDKLIENKKESLKELKKKLELVKPGSKRSALEEEIDCMRIWIDLILPHDFIGAIVAYSLGINKSSIKEVSEKTLLDAAIIAEKYGKRPSEIICKDGTFTSFNEIDIDKRAMMILYEYREKNKPQNKGKDKLKIGR